MKTILVGEWLHIHIQVRYVCHQVCHQNWCANWWQCVTKKVKTRGTTYLSQMSQMTSRMSMLSSDEDLDLEDPFVRQDNVRQFRYLRAQFEDETLAPGEIPDLVAEAECRYDNKGFGWIHGHWPASQPFSLFTAQKKETLDRVWS